MIGYEEFETKLMGILYKDKLNKKEVGFLLDAYADMNSLCNSEKSAPILNHMEEIMYDIEKKLDFGMLESSILNDFVEGYDVVQKFNFQYTYGAVPTGSAELTLRVYCSMSEMKKKLIDSYLGKEKV